MRTEWKIEGSVAWLVLIGVMPMVFGQSPRVLAKDANVLVSSPEPPQASSAPTGEIVREIDDPRNGDRWMLVRDVSHPGGPGRLVLAAGANIDSRVPANAKGAGGASAGADAPAPVIRAGDRVILEENTPIVVSQLEAVAMGPALTGSPFNARLTIGGKVVHAVAVGPGRAVFQKEPGQ